MKIRHFALIIFATATASYGQIYYDIDFNAPTHTAGSLVTVGAGSDTVSQINFGSPTIASTFDQLLAQPLVFNMAGNEPLFYYDQLQLNLLTSVAPRIRVDFDFDSMGLIGSAAHFVVLFDTPTVRNVYFDSAGHIRFYSSAMDGVYHDSTIGTFSDRDAFHVTIDIDQANNIWSVFKDEILVASSFFHADDSIQSIRFSYGLASSISRPDLSAVAIDNLKVTAFPNATAVPETSSFGLAAVAGLVGLVLARRCRRV